MPKHESIQQPSRLNGVFQEIGNVTLAVIDTLTLHAATVAAERQTGTHPTLSGINRDPEPNPGVIRTQSNTPDINK